MSDPVTNVEIEDVLSSIRRLVTNSDRVERGKPDSAGAPDDKLVLTPSLRVDRPDDDEIIEPEQELAEEHPADDTAGFSTSAPGDEPTDTAAARDEAAPARDAADPAPEASESGAEAADPSLPTDAGEAPFADAHDAERHGDEQVDAEDDSPTDPGLQDDDPDMLQRRAAEFEAIIAKTDDQWDPDGTTDDENTAMTGGPLPWDEGDVMDTGLEFRDEIDDLTDGENGNPPVRVESGAADDVLTDLETAPDAVGETGPDTSAEKPLELHPESRLTVFDGVGDTELDQSETDMSPFVFRSQSRLDAANTHELRSVPTGAPASDDADRPAPAEDALIDEEALRDLVSEIVRQELQGALGERITRNVRKLVRREIHRALASQELE